MDELDEAQMSELALDLRQLESQLSEARALALAASKPAPLDQQSVGRLSRMDAMQQQALAQNNLRTLEKRQAQVRAALEHAARGAYGLCRTCEEPIGYRRLKARPEAALCLGCQGGRER